jgi:hypothetical protein
MPVRILRDPADDERRRIVRIELMRKAVGERELEIVMVPPPPDRSAAREIGIHD